MIGLIRKRLLYVCTVVHCICVTQMYCYTSDKEIISGCSVSGGKAMLGTGENEQAFTSFQFQY